MRFKDSPKNLYLFVRLAKNADGEMLNCFVKQVAKYDGDENPTRYATSLTL